MKIRMIRIVRYDKNNPAGEVFDFNDFSKASTFLLGRQLNHYQIFINGHAFIRDNDSGCSITTIENEMAAFSLLHPGD